jgi:hypothetical protein
VNAIDAFCASASGRIRRGELDAVRLSEALSSSTGTFRSKQKSARESRLHLKKAEDVIWRRFLIRYCVKRAQLHDAVAQKLVLSGEQLLHQLIPALVHITHCAREMMIDSCLRGATEIIGDAENFIRRFPLAKQPLCVRTGRADCEELGGNSYKSREQQLLTVEFRPKPRHGMEQTARESFARARRVIHMPL